MQTYAVITPARNEAENLRRLATSLLAQTVRPDCWLVVDNGSTDGTAAVARELAERHDWIEVTSLPGTERPSRGGAVVRAFHAGLARLRSSSDIVVKLDADTSFDRDHFERLLGAFAADRTLGIASGACQEQQQDGTWTTLHVTRGGAWGAARAYRAACLQDVLPLDERIGWDGIDELKARVRGWTTTTVTGLTFRHHRKEGERDGARARRWAAAGEGMHYMGYRVSYLVLRALFRAKRDPAAVAMIAGYAWASASRRARCADADAVRYVRDRQRVRELARRRREAVGGT